MEINNTESFYNESDYNIHEDSNFGRWAIILIFLSTILQAYFGFARDATPFFKLCIALLCWGSVFCSLRMIRDMTTYPLAAKVTLYTLFGILSLSIIKSLMGGSVVAGIKYIVLFTNMYTALALVGIFFITSIKAAHEIRLLLKTTILTIFVSTLFLVFNYDITVSSYSLTYICAFAPIFIPYVGYNKKAILLIGMALAIFTYYGGGRQAAFILGIAFISLVISKLCNHFISYILSIVILLIPFFAIAYSLKHGSIFDIASNTIAVGEMFQIENDNVNLDTRTFLWVELLADFFQQDIWTQLFGKGAIAYYSSNFFRTNNRLGIEVPILQWLLQCGYLFVIAYTVIVVTAINRLYRYGNNRLCKIASILIAGFYCNCYVSNLVGCSIMQLGFWFLVSIAFNNSLLQATDDDILGILSYDEDFINQYYDVNEQQEDYNC